MRTLFLALIISLTLVACGTKENPAEQPATDAGSAEAAQQKAAAPKPTNGSTTGTRDIAPTGIVGSVQLINGNKMELTKLIKLGTYYIYITGKLNGRASTVISLTRFQDLRKWESFVFTSPTEFTINTRAGKTLKFTDAHLYLGEGSLEAYKFITIDNRYNEVPAEVKKSDVANITIK